MADTRDLKSLGVTTVRVRAPPPAPLRNAPYGTNPRLAARLLSQTGRFFASTPRSLRWIVELFFYLHSPLTARIPALRRGSMPDGAFLRFCIVTALLGHDAGLRCSHSVQARPSRQQRSFFVSGSQSLRWIVSRYLRHCHARAISVHDGFYALSSADERSSRFSITVPTLTLDSESRCA